MYQDGSSFVCFSGSCDDAGFHGAVEFALKDLTSRSLDEVHRAIYGDGFVASEGFRFVIDTDPEEDDEAEEAELPDLSWLLDCHPIDSSAGSPGAAYLLGRGIPTEIAAQYGIMYSTDEKAVAFPVLVGSRLVGWQYRFLKERVFSTKSGKTVRQKVWSTPGMPRGRVVMFQNRLVGAKSCVLCEGARDALGAHFIGGNVATMGKNVSDGQVALIRASGVSRVYVALDPDAAADFEPLARRFEGLETFKVVVPQPYKDLGEMPLDEATDTILAAEPLRPRSIHFFFA